MGTHERLGLLRELEQVRGRPVITYITSPRFGASGEIAADAVSELMSQLNLLPAGSTALDFLIVSNGGDPTVAWRIVSLIRERVSRFSVLVPQAAYSAATLIALGADEIVMHPNGNLGPTDPQIRSRRSDKPSFGAEDLAAFLRFAKDEVGITNQAEILSVFNHFCEEVGSVAVGVAARSTQLGVSMGEKLLQLHMVGDGDKSKARAISEKLTRDFFHHGYPVSRKEAKQIGLPIADSLRQAENIMWKIWVDVSDELELRSAASDIEFLAKEQNCAALFAGVPHIATAAPNAPGAAVMAPQVVVVPGAPFERTHALMESPRLASRFVSRGHVLAGRMQDLTLKVSKAAIFQGWETVGPLKVNPSVAASRPTAHRTSPAKKSTAKPAKAHGRTVKP